MRGLKLSLQNIIAVAGLFAAVFSAAAAAFAVKQSKLQRTTLTKPQLIVTNIRIPIIGKSDELFPYLPEDDDHDPYFKVPIKNVGLGTALNLKYSWIFDYQNALDACGFLKSETHQLEKMNSAVNIEEIENTVYAEEDRKNGLSYFSFFKKNKFQSFSNFLTYSDIEYIIPITQDKNNTFLTLPYLVPILTINSSLIPHSFSMALLEEKQSGKLKVDYEDISGCRFSIMFTCTIKLVKYRIDLKSGSSAEYEFNIHRLHKIPFSKKILNVIASSLAKGKDLLIFRKK